MTAHDATRLGRLSPLIKAKVIATDPSRETGFVERTTLFVVALKKEQALRLLDGFATAARQRARVFARQLVDLDSPTRQARVALEFGVRDGTAERVKQLLTEAPPALRSALTSQLPARLRPAGLPPHEGLSPALSALAARLVREVTR
jgi:hypothetical protein